MKAATIFLGFAAIFVTCAATVQAQDAKDLYYNYETATATASATAGRNGSTTIVNNSRRRRNQTSRRQTPAATNSRPANAPTGVAAVNPATGAAATGLPGTKVLIDLNRGGKRQFVTANYKFRTGDKIRLILKTNFDGYIAMINKGTTGKFSLLYPYAGADDRVRPSADIQFPKEGDWIEFDGNSGTEELTIVMSKVSLVDRDREITWEGWYKNSGGKDLFVSSDAEATYAVCAAERLAEPVAFTLRLKHGR